MATREVQFAELCSLVTALGKDGGLISPSIYDTAQVIRLYPPKEGVEPALHWLLNQQRADGGWGEPEVPYARDVPTLAAVLALHTYAGAANTGKAQHSHAIDAGLAFLDQQAEQWAEMPMDALPIATEMILPYLIEEANRLGLGINRAPYATLYQLRDRKCRYISSKPLEVSSPPTHSWEALGQQVQSIRPDRSGGIGHSPAATAAWLGKAQQPHGRMDICADNCATAQKYLVNAAAATGVDIPGVVPNVWPITGFELVYAPYTLLATGLLQHPAVGERVAPILDRLGSIMQCNNGMSFGECFTPDVDDTGLALAVLQATSRPVDPATVLQFSHGDHFCTFHHELNPSIFANAHALYGLAYTNKRYPAAENFLCERQSTDGRWLADKLHRSWLYTTLELVLILNSLGYTMEVQKAVDALLRHQHGDGGWSSGKSATRLETSYALITLSTLGRCGLLPEAGKNALQSGHQWLNNAYSPYQFSKEQLWFGKELYAPYRVDRIYELSTLLSVAEDGVLL